MFAISDLAVAAAAPRSGGPVEYIDVNGTLSFMNTELQGCIVEISSTTGFVTLRTTQFMVTNLATTNTDSEQNYKRGIFGIRGFQKIQIDFS